MKNIDRIIISGGGTGGHIFPAVAIADEVKKRNPKAEILFIGAIGKMEMEKVPAAGYKIVGLNIAGFQRKFTLSNFLLPFKIIGSLWKAKKIIKKFKPQVVVGVGGYASGPTLKMATMLGIPTLIQEQNSFPGKTNKLLAEKVSKICTAYEGLERFFPKNKIVITGNPVRLSSIEIEGKKEKALNYYKFDPQLKTIFIMGGSLGAKTLNESVLNHLDLLNEHNIQVLWQCGKFYKSKMDEALITKNSKNIRCVDFIAEMSQAYAIADLIISRAGAISVSELAILGKPTILVPSPNVAEDHQTKNAMSLVEKNAAILIKDNEAREQLIPQAIEVLNNIAQQEALSNALKLLGKPKATEDIVDVISEIIA